MSSSIPNPVSPPIPKPPPEAPTAAGPFFRSPERGARSLVWLSLSEQAAALTGEYVQDEKVLSPSAQAQDDTLAEGLWERSAQLVGLSADTPA